MPPRFAYWTILAGGLPTAFRATEREELLPTFKRIQEKHPDAEMKYFARGKLWESREAAQAPPPREHRGRDWRPGGDHRDPRQKFIDENRKRNQERRKDRFARNERVPPKDGAAPNRPSARPHVRPRGRPPARPAGRPSGRPPGNRRRS